MNAPLSAEFEILRYYNPNVLLSLC